MAKKETVLPKKRIYTQDEINNIIIHCDKEKAINIIFKNGYALSLKEARRIYCQENGTKDL